MPNQSLTESGTPPDLLLVCNAIITSRSTNLSVMKDYLPQLLENEQTVSCSHYKRLIDRAAFRFSISLILPIKNSLIVF